jgi:crotonobetainyl-CoA:carnitine CoA-transferase CaiB-like acyl-CoA transferase
MRFSETKVRRDKAGPLLGEDSISILGELGYPEADIRDLAQSGVIAVPAVERRVERREI